MNSQSARSAVLLVVCAYLSLGSIDDPESAAYLPGGAGAGSLRKNCLDLGLILQTCSASPK